ncbi:MAG: phosphoribosylformylglycinamidine synthase subunit PurS, partial [Candidatus Aenigmatarchaeota archaeon]
MVSTRKKPRTLQIATKPEFLDATGELLKQKLNEVGIKAESVRSSRKITFDFALSSEQIKKLQLELTDPVTEFSTVDEQIEIGDGRLRSFLRTLGETLHITKKRSDFVIEVSRKPGVTDPEGRTAKEIAGIILDDDFANKGNAYTSSQFLVKGSKEEDVKKAATTLLANPLIEDVFVTNYRKWDRKAGLKRIPKVGSTNGITVDYLDLDVDDKKLLSISSERVLSLNLEEMHKISNEYKRTDFAAERASLGLESRPTDVELEAIAQTWSEHCKHKIFNAMVRYTDKETGKSFVVDSLFKTYIKGSTETISQNEKWKNVLVSVFKDNAGIVKFNDMYNMLLKIETHNSPSAKDPYGGAITGVNGCHRDIIGAGMGAEIIASTDVLCFGDPNYDGYIPSTILHPNRIRKGVFKGIEHAGNKTGIPT